MAKNAYWADGSIGGTTGTIDKIPGAGLQDKDILIQADQTDARIYSLDDDSGATESFPSVVSPDTDAGTKRWLLQGLILPNTGLKLLDTNSSHTLQVKWNENDSANRTLNLLIAGADRSLTLNENFTIGNGTDITITGVGQANALTLYESLTVGDGNSGTITFSAASKVLTVEDTSVVNQDLTTDAYPTLAGLLLNSAATPSSQFKVQADSAGVLSILVRSVDNAIIGFDADYVSPNWKARDTEAALIQKSVGYLYFIGNASLTPGDTYSPTALLAMNLATGDFDVMLHDAATVGLKLGGTLITASGAELNYVDGVTSAIQTQLNAKQASDATLTSIALLGTAADKMLYTTDVDTWAEAAITAAGRSMVGAADAAAQLALLSGQAGASFSLNSQALTSVGAIGCGTITTTGNIVMPNGGTIGQAAGPLITFNDTDNYLGITGCKVGVGVLDPSHAIEADGDLMLSGSSRNIYLNSDTAIEVGTGFRIHENVGSVYFDWKWNNIARFIQWRRSNSPSGGGSGGPIMTWNTYDTVAIGSATFPATLTKGICIASGTAPTADVANQASMWVADQAAGNACVHTRTENSAVIKLYQCAKADYNNWAAFGDVVNALVAIGLFDAA